MSRPRTKPNLNKIIWGEVTQSILETSKGCDPNKCMYKVGVAIAINVPHGYVKVDSSGVAITRRTDYREKAFLPANMKRNMILFDEYHTQLDLYKKGKLKEMPVLKVKPHRFKLTFIKTTKVYRATDERKAQVNKARQKRKDEGRPDKKYSLHERIVGLSKPKE